MSQLIRWSLARLYELQPGIFSAMEDALPDPLNQEHLVRDYILEQYGDMGIAFPVNRFAFNIDQWAKRHKKMFADLAKVMVAEYNPIENYDRFEETTDSSTGSGTSTSSGTGESSANGTSTEKKVAYDTEILKPTDSSDATSGSTSKSSNTGSSTSKEDSTRVSHIHGNIGVTTAPQMLREYAEFSSFNAFQRIADEFAKDLLVGIYFF